MAAVAKTMSSAVETMCAGMKRQSIPLLCMPAISPARLRERARIMEKTVKTPILARKSTLEGTGRCSRISGSG